jgi:ABC-type branched-subunit amino acid transport system ATPase component
VYIASFRIENYKSFRETPEIALTPGFNVVVGQNNAGKTALLEALSLSGGAKAHRSLRVAPTALSPNQGNSVTSITYSLSREDVLELLRDQSDLHLPLYEQDQPGDALIRFTATVSKGLVLTCTYAGGAVIEASLAGYERRKRLGQTVRLRISKESKEFQLITNEDGLAPGNHLDYVLGGRLKEWIYIFRAERFNVGVSQSGATGLLSSNASNLPEVLANLQGRNPRRYQRLTDWVRAVFPLVKDVSVRPAGPDHVEIITWTTDPVLEREDLAVPLSESGTGIGQVLAILYVALTAETPRVVLIDEPQSFLHPGAVRKLIEILKQHPQHQFMITTHSPTALTAADPDTLLRLRIDEGETIIDRLDVTEARDLRLVLADVGARLSDVFGADAILWVEGRTEEQCFPKIIQSLSGRPLLGTAIVGVLHTAEFEARRSEATIELYNRLASGHSLLPPAVGFIFDREGRPAAMRVDLERHGNVLFLDRRMYENYLLNPAAIAAVASGITNFRDPALSEDDVVGWLDANRWGAKYFDPLPSERTDGVWLREVRGDRLLSDLFAQLSEQRVPYDKIRHGVALTDWLLENAPSQLSAVAELIEKALTPRGK